MRKPDEKYSSSLVLLPDTAVLFMFIVIVNILWDFMQLALRYHPDKNLDKPESTEKVKCFYTSVYIRSTILLCFLQYVLGNRSVTFSYFFSFSSCCV